MKKEKRVKQYLVRILSSDGHWGAWKDIGADNEQLAAEKAIEVSEWESANFLVGAGSEKAKIEVTNKKGLVKTFIVSGESSPVYHARLFKVEI